MIYKPFLVFITEADGRSLRQVNGNITAGTSPRPLAHTPDKWMEMLISWERDARKHGIIRAFSTDLDFVLDGAHILRHAFINQNIERKLYFLIKRLTLDITDTDYNFIYRYLYRGEIDLSTLVCEETHVSANIMEGGLVKLLKAGEATVMEFPLDSDPDFVYLYMDGISITGIYQWALPEYTTGSTGALPTMVLVGEEQKAPGVAAFDIAGGYSFSPGSININSTEYFLEIRIAPEGGLGTFTGLIRMSDPHPAFAANIILHIFNTTTNSVRAHIDLYTGAEAAEITINKTITVQEGDRFFLEIDEYRYESNLIFTIQNRFPGTYVKAFTPVTLYNRLVDRILGADALRSSALLQLNNNLLVTCGDAVRGINGARVKTKLLDFFDAYNVILNAGMGIENKTLTFESKARYYDPTNPIPLGPATGLKWMPAVDVMANTIKIGYPVRDIEDVNGKYSPNNSHIYTTAITRVPVELSLISPYITDPYYIELKRVNLEGKNTTDDNSDNDVMVINALVDQEDTVTEISFLAAGNVMIIPLGLGVAPGQLIRITGSNLNDGDYRITAVASILIAQVITVTGTPLTDESSGPSVFFQFLQGRLYRLNRPAYDNAVNPTDFGVPSPTSIFNIDTLTPKRLLLTHGNWIHSIMRGFDSEKLVFSTTEKNRNLKTVQGSITIDEDADQDISRLSPPLFIPVYIEAEVEVPEALIDLLESGTNRAFSVTWDGITYVGFLKKLALSPANNKSQTVKLLLAPDNDLSKLVNP